MLNIYLYNVNRNLNRIYRTCEAFGITNIKLINVDKYILQGNLFKAKDRVNIDTITSFPDGKNILSLETYFKIPIWNINFSKVKGILLGGETTGLPIIKTEFKAYIPMQGKISSLTVEAALSITLYQRSLYFADKMR